MPPVAGPGASGAWGYRIAGVDGGGFESTFFLPPFRPGLVDPESRAPRTFGAARLLDPPRRRGRVRTGSEARVVITDIHEALYEIVNDIREHYEDAHFEAERADKKFEAGS